MAMAAPQPMQSLGYGGPCTAVLPGPHGAVYSGRGGWLRRTPVHSVQQPRQAQQQQQVHVFDGDKIHGITGNEPDEPTMLCVSGTYKIGIVDVPASPAPLALRTVFTVGTPVVKTAVVGAGAATRVFVLGVDGWVAQYDAAGRRLWDCDTRLRQGLAMSGDMRVVAAEGSWCVTACLGGMSGAVQRVDLRCPADDVGTNTTPSVTHAKAFPAAHAATGHVRCVAVDASRVYVATACDDRTVAIWSADPDAPAHLRTLRGHQARVWSVAIAFPYVVSGGEDMTVRLWDAETGACLKAWSTGRLGGVWAVGLTTLPDEVRVWSGTTSGTLKAHRFPRGPAAAPAATCVESDRTTTGVALNEDGAHGTLRAVRVGGAGTHGPVDVWTAGTDGRVVCTTTTFGEGGATVGGSVLLATGGEAALANVTEMAPLLGDTSGGRGAAKCAVVGDGEGGLHVVVLTATEGAEGTVSSTTPEVWRLPRESTGLAAKVVALTAADDGSGAVAVDATGRGVVVRVVDSTSDAPAAACPVRVVSTFAGDPSMGLPTAAWCAPARCEGAAVQPIAVVGTKRGALRYIFRDGTARAVPHHVTAAGRQSPVVFVGSHGDGGGATQFFAADEAGVVGTYGVSADAVVARDETYATGFTEVVGGWAVPAGVGPTGRTVAACRSLLLWHIADGDACATVLPAGDTVARVPCTGVSRRTVAVRGSHISWVCGGKRVGVHRAGLHGDIAEVLRCDAECFVGVDDINLASKVSPAADSGPVYYFGGGDDGVPTLFRRGAGTHTVTAVQRLFPPFTTSVKCCALATIRSADATREWRVALAGGGGERVSLWALPSGALLYTSTDDAGGGSGSDAAVAADRQRKKAKRSGGKGAPQAPTGLRTGTLQRILGVGLTAQEPSPGVCYALTFAASTDATLRVAAVPLPAAAGTTQPATLNISIPLPDDFGACLSTAVLHANSVPAGARIPSSGGALPNDAVVAVGGCNGFISVFQVGLRVGLDSVHFEYTRLTAHRAHSSGVNCLAWAIGGEGAVGAGSMRPSATAPRMRIISGGDDQAVAYTSFRIDPDGVWALEYTAKAALFTGGVRAVRAVASDAMLFYAVSSDQRVVECEVIEGASPGPRPRNAAIHVTRGAVSGVGRPTSLHVHADGAVVVAGQGVEMFAAA